VLVGPNDTGKSAFLAALRWCVEGQALHALDRWRYAADPASYIQTDAGTHKTGQGVPELRPVGFYQLPSIGIATVSPGVRDEPASPPQLSADGGNLPTLLDYLLRRERKRYDAVVNAVKARVPGLEDLHIRTPDAAKRQLELELEAGLRISADQASTGVRVVLFFVALAYHPDPPKLLLIEEPETGVHPKRLEDIVGLLRDITLGKYGGHAAQVVLSTHSPYLLDCVNLEQDQVLVFRRDPDGSRSAEPVDSERLGLFLDEFMLGEVWFNQGEEGLVKRAQ
jgi:hypothetical protein